MADALVQSDWPFPVRRGKVRDVYDIGEVNGTPALLIVATDRISAFDVVFPTPIPGKGKILTALSLFWFAKFPQFENHLITSHVEEFSGSLRPFVDQLQGRSMLVKKTDVIPIECVARGYLAGSGWSEYRQSQTICGTSLPAGLAQCAKLSTPIFTPATKESSGHDVNISHEQACKMIGSSTMQVLRERTLSLYTQAADYAAARGVIIADTKFEFGQLSDGRIILIDEILTPDSSRFWPAESYLPGRDQSSFDKQYLRNWLEAHSWNKQPPAPPLPVEIVQGTRRRYLEAYEKLTSQPME